MRFTWSHLTRGSCIKTETMGKRGTSTGKLYIVGLLCLVVLLYLKIMPPKKPAVRPADPVPSSNEAPAKEKAAPKSGAGALHKLATHPSTAIMVKEALKELDSRKGVSSQAIQNYIKQKYPSVDLVRLKHLVRRALKKGIENGTLVRPANSTVTTGATGKFRLAPKIKPSKPKAENMDPNVQKAPKAAEEGAKKPKKTGMKNPCRNICSYLVSVPIICNFLKVPLRRKTLQMNRHRLQSTSLFPPVFRTQSLQESPQKTKGLQLQLLLQQRGQKLKLLKQKGMMREPLQPKLKRQRRPRRQRRGKHPIAKQLKQRVMALLLKLRANEGRRLQSKFINLNYFILFICNKISI
uniref:H15 domain-containing protein n=1 Tax=Amphiprion ocellaris TaxID=80972 RepID=A0AAQ5X9B8_AMPOC